MVVGYTSWIKMLALSSYSMTSVVKLKRHPLNIPVRSNINTIKGFQFTYNFHNFNTKYLSFYKSRDLNYNNWGINLFNTSDNILQGVLTENNKPVYNVFVNLYHSISGTLVTRSLTDLEGRFTFSSIVADAKYYIVASDPKGVYNTVTLDNIRIDSRKDYTVDVG